MAEPDIENTVERSLNVRRGSGSIPGWALISPSLQTCASVCIWWVFLSILLRIQTSTFDSIGPILKKKKDSVKITHFVWFYYGFMRFKTGITFFFWRKDGGCNYYTVFSAVLGISGTVAWKVKNKTKTCYILSLWEILFYHSRENVPLICRFCVKNMTFCLHISGLSFHPFSFSFHPFLLVLCSFLSQEIRKKPYIICHAWET